MERRRGDKKSLLGRALFTVCAFLAGFGMLSGSAGAYVQDDLDYLNDKGNCSVGYLGTPCDLSGATLSGKNLAGADFSGANLSGANLSGADLSNANLSNTNLSNANLSGAKLNGAKLFGINLAGVNLSGINLPDLNLSGLVLGAADLSNADLRRAKLSKTGLKGAKLFGTKLAGSDLREADLRGADLRWADLSGADASGANLSEASLYAANLNGANLNGANILNAQLGGAIWTDGVICGSGSIGRCAGVFRQEDVDRLLSTKQCPNGHLSGANLAGADLSGANLAGADLYGASLPKANLKGAKLAGATLEGANLYAADLTGIDMKEGVLSWADLREAYLADADLRWVTMYKVNLTQAYLPGAKLTGSRLKEANLSYANLSRTLMNDMDLTGAYLPYANLAGANLSGTGLSGANLANANLSSADMTNAWLTGANLSGANLKGATLTGQQSNLSDDNRFYGTNLAGADLTGAILNYVRFSHTNLYGANMAGVNAYAVSFEYCDMRGVNLSAATLVDTSIYYSDLRNANLSGARMSDYWGADMRGSDFSGADLSGVHPSRRAPDPGPSAFFSGASLAGAKLNGAVLPRADLKGVDLNKADLSGADLVEADLSGAYLPGANLSGANLSGANLGKANLSGANLTAAILNEKTEKRGANLTSATWTDGSVCAWGSIGRCLSSVKPSSVTGTVAFDSLTPELFLPGETAPAAKSLAGAVKSVAAAVKSIVTASPEPLVFKTRYFVLYEGERPLLAIETSGLSVRVIEGVLHYGGSYQYYVLDASTTDEVMAAVGPVPFTTPARPEDEDDYGNPLIAQGLKDAQGRSIPLADTRLATLITAGAGLLPQQGTLTAIGGAAGAMKGQNGITLATMNTNDVRVVRSKGGQGQAVIIAASDANIMETIRPLTDSGHSMDKGGNLKPDVTLVPSNIRLPLGLFDFSVSIANNTNRTDVVIVPPTPFGTDTKWYKVGTGGTLKEYPNFRVDALGNGILTLYDNDVWDKNPAFGIVRDPGGPGAPDTATPTAASGGGGGCFIATAAYGSYVHPLVNILRAFRDTVLLPSALGNAFVQWYYRVSPPVADIIARHGSLSAAVRITLLPAIGLAWLCLKVGVLPAAVMLLAFCILVAMVVRSGWRRRSFIQ